MLLSACHLQTVHLTNPVRRPRGKEFWTNIWDEQSLLCSARMAIGRRALSPKRCLRSRPSFAIDPPALNSICVAANSGLWKSAATNYSQIMGNEAFGDSSNSVSGARFYSTFLMFSLIFLQLFLWLVALSLITQKMFIIRGAWQVTQQSFAKKSCTAHK